MAFTPDEQQALQRERVARLRSTPISRYVYVDVSFDTANQDTDIALGDLKPQDPDAVRWVPVSLSTAATIYRDLSGTAVAWQQSHIKLRSSAICDARLLLFVEAS